jgi:tetratricopeptide (TPR) repeat protein
VNENIDSIKRTLANSLQAWLLIFDNADDPDLSLAPYFPAGDRGDILITSRNPQCQAYNTVGYQEVGRLSPKDSVSLLDKIIYGATSRSQEASEEDQKIVETVGHLALAIVQAGAYIRETSCSLHDYLELYKRRRRNLLQDLPKHLGTDYKRSVYATWQVTVDMIESMQDAASYSALRLLSLLGFYHHDQIPIQMFYNVQHQSQTDPVPDYLPWHESSSEDDYQQSVQASITLLASFSLITRNADASLSLHPLVHEWCRDRMFADEQLSYQRALSLLANSVHWEFETKDYTFRRSLVSHVQELLRLRDHGEVSEEQAMKQWPVLALILSESGWMTDALKLQEEITTLYRGNLGEDHPATLSSMAHLVKDYINAGRREEAQQLAEEMIVLQKSKLGVDHSTTWWLMHNLAILYNSVGRRVQALQLTEDVLKLQKNKLGEDHPDTVISMHNLAIWYCEVGRRAEARQLIEEVVNLWKSKLGEDHPNTLGSMHNLANVYSEAGRRADALQMIKEVVNLRKSKLVEDHPDTLWSMHTLAVLYSGTGRRADALQLIKEVVNMRKSKLGEDHPNTILSEGLLANLSQGTETSSTS